MTRIPNFSDLPLFDSGNTNANPANPVKTEAWTTPEGIDVKPIYGADDLAGLDHLNTMPGMPPFLRGPYPTMYVQPGKRDYRLPSTLPPIADMTATIRG